MTLYHAALPDDWREAQRTGSYRVSTRGRSLDQEGFVHASYAHQVEGVANRFYADVDELILLEIDPQLLDVDVIDESPTGDPADQHFPHIYGPVPVAAVVTATPWRRGADGWRRLDGVVTDV